MHLQQWENLLDFPTAVFLTKSHNSLSMNKASTIKYKNNKGRNRNAFTMMELIVVVILISVLSAIAIPRYGKTIERFHATEGKKVLLDILGAQKRYHLEFGEYASATEHLDIEIPNNLKYFMNVVTGAGLSDTVGNITRNGNLYILYICSDGQLLCKNLPGPTDYCAIIDIPEMP